MTIAIATFVCERRDHLNPCVCTPCVVPIEQFQTHQHRHCFDGRYDSCWFLAALKDPPCLSSLACASSGGAVSQGCNTMLWRLYRETCRERYHKKYFTYAGTFLTTPLGWVRERSKAVSYSAALATYIKRPDPSSKFVVLTVSGDFFGPLDEPCRTPFRDRQVVRAVTLSPPAVLPQERAHQQSSGGRRKRTMKRKCSAKPYLSALAPGLPRQRKLRMSPVLSRSTPRERCLRYQRSSRGRREPVPDE